MKLLNSLFGKKQLQLRDVVELTSEEIFRNSLGQVRTLIQQNVISELGSDPAVFTQKAWTIVLELMVFHLYLADCIANGNVGSQKCSRFMRALLATVPSGLSTVFGCNTLEAKLEFERDFLSRYNHRCSFYVSLSLTGDSKESPKGWLFWEAAQGMASEFFPDHEAGATIVLSVILGQCLPGLKDLRVRLLEARDL